MKCMTNVGIGEFGRSASRECWKSCMMARENGGDRTKANTGGGGYLPGRMSRSKERKNKFLLFRGNGLHDDLMGESRVYLQIFIYKLNRA